MHLLLISHFKWLTDSKYDIYCTVYTILYISLQVYIIISCISFGALILRIVRDFTWWSFHVMNASGWSRMHIRCLHIIMNIQNFRCLRLAIEKSTVRVESREILWIALLYRCIATEGWPLRSGAQVGLGATSERAARRAAGARVRVRRERDSGLQGQLRLHLARRLHRARPRARGGALQCSLLPPACFHCDLWVASRVESTWIGKTLSESHAFNFALDDRSRSMCSCWSRTLFLMQTTESKIMLEFLENEYLARVSNFALYDIVRYEYKYIATRLCKRTAFMPLQLLIIQIRVINEFIYSSSLILYSSWPLYPAPILAGDHSYNNCCSQHTYTSICMS